MPSTRRTIATNPENADMALSLSCPICMENYTETRYPVVAPECAHSICVNCARTRSSNVCVTCNASSHYGRQGYDNNQGAYYYAGSAWPSNDWKHNFALSELVRQHSEFVTREAERERTRREETEREIQIAREQKEREVQTEKKARERVEREMAEMKKRYEKELPNDVDYMSCSLCHTKERRERLKICVSCANEGKVELKDTEEKILPFIICSHCSQEDHGGHQIVKYLPWKTKKVLCSIVSYGQSTVASMDEVCRYESEKGVKVLGEWNQHMDVFRIVDDKLAYRECLDIESAVKAEAELVCGASEDTLPTLRIFTKCVEDSKQRLKRLASKMNGEEEEEKEDNDEVVEVRPKKKRSSGRVSK